MNRIGYQKLIGEYLYPYFEHKKYVPTRTPGEFRRKTSFGHSAVHYHVVLAEGGAAIQFHVGLRHELVEVAMSSLFGQRSYYQTDSQTLSVDSRTLGAVSRADDRSERSPIIKPAEVGAFCDGFIDFMDRSGFAFLEKYSNLSAVDRLYNNLPSKSAEWCNHSYQRCFRGMTVAEIMRRLDLRTLREMHRSYLLSRGYGSGVIEKFDINFARPGKISLN